MSSLRALFSTFPLAHQAGRDIEIAREDCLAGALAQAKRANLFGCKRLNRRETKLIEFAHGPLVHHSGRVKAFGCLVNRRHQAATILFRFSHRIKVSHLVLYIAPENAETNSVG